MKVLAIETKTGKVVWEQTAYEGPVFDARHRRSTFAGPSAITDGKMIFAYFGPEGLYAYDFSGKPAWSVVEKFHTLGLGTGTSPVLHENLVIIQRDQDEKTSVVVAYDKATGKEVWKTPRPVDISWSTPVLVKAGSRTELITNALQHVIAYDASTGKELWRTKGVESNAIHAPLVGKDMVVVTAGYPAKRTIAIRTGDVPDDKRIMWEFTKGTGYVLSNILYGDYVYLSTDNGIITCLEATTGKVDLRGRTPAQADPLHGIRGRIQRHDRNDQRGWRHLHVEGGSETRDRPHQQRRRAGVFLGGAGQRPRLHPRREASVRDRALARPTASFQFPASRGQLPDLEVGRWRLDV